MPGGKENSRKRNAPEPEADENSAPRDTLVLEVTEGPAKGSVYNKQVRKDRWGAAALCCCDAACASA